MTALLTLAGNTAPGLLLHAGTRHLVQTAQRRLHLVHYPGVSLQVVEPLGDDPGHLHPGHDLSGHLSDLSLATE